MKTKRYLKKDMYIADKGQSLVELSITLPIIFLLIFVIMAFGFYIYDMSVYTFASNKALDKGIGVVVSGKLKQSDIDEIKNEALNYTNVRLFASKPTIDVTNHVNASTGESKLAVSIESNYNFSISFVNNILGNNSKISSKSSYMYKK